MDRDCWVLLNWVMLSIKPSLILSDFDIIVFFFCGRDKTFEGCQMITSNTFRERTEVA